MIPLVDLAPQHTMIADEVERGWARVVEHGGFILGEEVARFEREYAGFLGTRHCIGVANGTDALELALRAMGIGIGDEVVLPTNSFVATAEAVRRAGATPVLADVDPDTYLVSPEQIADRVGPRTRAIVAVHLYGQIAPVEAILPLVRDDLALLEDAAQAHGAMRHGVAAGRFGLAAATSFYPGKNLGAYGDAGAVLTDSAAIDDAVRRMRNHGSRAKYDHEDLGFNSRLDAMQAVVLLAKLRHLEAWNEDRRRAAARYDLLLSDLEEVARPQVLNGNDHVWHLYVVRVSDRDEVVAKLNEAGIGAGIHYPVPIHLQGAFRDLGHRRGDFPVAERAAQEILSLPIYPGITEAQQERVVDEVRKAIR